MKNKNIAGFSFVELLLYMGIVTIMSGTLISFALNIMSGNAKSSTEQEVYANARFAAERIKYEIRNASGINAISSNSISLATAISATNPTVIDLSAGKVRIKQGTGAVVDVHSTNTRVSSLTFTNYTSSDNKTKNIGFRFTMDANFGSSRQEYNHTITMQSAAEVRSN